MKSTKRESALTTAVFAALLAFSAPASAKTSWASANNVNLRYELTGQGPNTVVLLHEMSMALESWDGIMPTLAGNRQVLRYDLRGFGLSQRISGSITMSDEMEDLRALLDTLGIKGKVTLVGGAVGGAIAMNFAAVHPERVNGLVAISPAAYMRPQPERVPKAPGPSAASAPPAPTPSTQATDQDSLFSSAKRKAHPENYQRYRAIQAATDRVAPMATAAMVYSVGFKDILPTIQCPTVIVATSLFKAHTVEEFKELADGIPKGRLEILETGHFAAIESPELVGPVLAKFLKEVESAR